jgi:hypothetical protein
MNQLDSPPPSPAGSFFLTLCPVAAPVPVPKPTAPSMQRFRFFFSRRHEVGEERYWLHFGHFETHAEAQKWLRALHSMYPGAVVCKVPGSQSAAEGHSQ